MKQSVILAMAIAVSAMAMQPADARTREPRQDRADSSSPPAENDRSASEDRQEKGRRDNRERRESKPERRPEASTPENRPNRESRPRQDRPRRDQPRGDAQQAARTAQRMNGGGRVLSVTPDGGTYEVRLLKDGEVRSYRIPAN